MSGEHKETSEIDIIDGYLKIQNIDALYRYMQGQENQEPALCGMLEIWSLEKTREERTIFWNVFSYKDAIEKYSMIDQIMKLIICEAELSLPIIQFIDKEISVWAMLAWALMKQLGMRQIEVLEAISNFLKERHCDSGKISVVEAVYMESLQKELYEALIHQDGYLAKKLLVKIPDSESKAVLLKEAEDKITQVEQKIQGRLCTPTVMEKIGEYYMIVDCWHSRVLYARELCDIKDWNVLDADLQHPHSICQGKGIYAVENTEDGSLCFYKEKESFVKIDQFPAGKRPHRLLYDEKREMFWALAGESQEIYGIKCPEEGPAEGGRRPEGTYRTDGRMELCFQQKIKELQSTYVRSMSIIGDRFYIVSGPGYILELSFTDDKFLVENTYTVPEEYFSMNDITYFHGYFWISVYQNSERKDNPALLRLPSLKDFGTGNCVNLYDTLGMKGIPYFFSWVDGKLCIPEIDTYSRIVLYDADNGELKVNKVLYDFGEPELSDIVHKHKNDKEIREYVLESMHGDNGASEETAQ